MRSRIQRRTAFTIAVLTCFSLIGSALPSVAGPPGDNGPIVYAAADGLYQVQADGAGADLILAGAFHSPDVSPDGTQVLVAEYPETAFDGAISIVDIATGAQTSVVDSGATSAVWSGDGSAIAYAADGLFVIEGTDAARLVRDDVGFVFDWSPVDDRILADRAVESDVFPEVYLETVDAETGEAVTIGNNGPGLFTWYPTGGDFSPDGSQIVYGFNTPGYSALVYAGQEADPIYDTNVMGAPTGDVSWSPDGASIAYRRSTAEEGEVLVIHSVESGSETTFANVGTEIDWAPTPADVGGDTEFDDVPADNIYHDDIVWLAEQGITKGCNPPDNTNFCPDDNVTRGQMAAFLVRALGYTDGAGSDLFGDDDESVFENDIDLLATAGVTKGCNPPDNTNFCPDDNVTRGQMAAFLHRALGG